jgi:hypothetical protein
VAGVVVPGRCLGVEYLVFVHVLDPGLEIPRARAYSSAASPQPHLKLARHSGRLAARLTWPGSKPN